VNRVLVALLASFVVASALSQSAEPTSIRITTWNLEWFPNGSAHDATPEGQTQRIAAAADVLRPIVAIAQLLTHIHDVISTMMPTIKGVVIGGDFNTNHDQDMFAAERTLDSLVDAGYWNGFEGLPLPERVTHPGTHGFPDATFDFIFAKGLMASQPAITRTNASDYWPVTRSFRLH
jgi:endonuclease/exonuclease/phosphatase (EEP) superfamily protein YafD